MIAFGVALIAMLALTGCGGGHKSPTQQKVAPQQVPSGSAPGEGLSSVSAEVRSPATGDDCVRRLQEQARTSGMDVAVRQVRSQPSGFSCTGDLVPRRQ